MIAIIFLLLLITPTWSLAQETQQEAQEEIQQEAQQETQQEAQEEGPISLVEAARRERERRAALDQEVKILTNRDVEEMGGLVSIATAPETEEEGAEEGETDDRTWEERFAEAKLDLETAENRGEILRLQMEYLRDQWLRSSDGTTQQRIQQQLQDAQLGLELSQQEIEAARAAYEELQREAEEAGLLPGELRELMADDS